MHNDKYRNQQIRNAIVYNPSFSASSQRVNSDPSLPACIRLIRERHENVLAAIRDTERSRALSENLLSLRLAEAFLEKGELIRRIPDHPPQIAVIGPTQAGKSSVVNLLLGENRARVSPLAGYTVHPQAFCLNLDLSKAQWLEAYFQGYRRCRPEQLSHERYDCFSLSDPIVRPHHPLGSALIWDTPDFDSVDAGDYRSGIVRTAALADAILLVVSKDKYADQSVWEFMRLLEPLGQPTVICLNKVTAASEATLLRSLQQKWREARGDKPATVAALRWFEALDAEHHSLPLTEAEHLLQPLAKAMSIDGRAAHATRSRRLIAEHWQDWQAPIAREQAARAEWDRMVDAAVDDALSIYRRDYLDHPQHYESFQRALAELLTLLEIPGLADGIAMARRIVTWPLRQLAGLLTGARSRHREEIDQETSVLNRTMEHLYIRAGEALLRKSEEDPALAGWWREMGWLLRSERKHGEESRAAAITRHHRLMQPEIEHTARQLFDKLQEQPAVLNGLRATRVTTDATALAVALHTGGIGLHDFLIAPAILSLTSLLAESALGHYMQRAEAELKQRQYREVEKLFHEVPRAGLLRLPDRLDPNGKFNIPAQTLATVESYLS